jgi:hypothetical protein
MENANNKTSPEKENRKVQADKQSKDYPVREGEDNSIYKEKNDKGDYPYNNADDKQFDNQAEFIDPNSNTKEEKS